MNSPKITPLLVEAGAEAVDAVMTVMDQAFDRTFGEAWQREQCLGIIGLPGVWLTLAIDCDKVLGFALTRMIADEAELLLIAVAPNNHKRGIGTSLLKDIINASSIRGAKRLHLEVRDGNPASNLYHRFGFVRVGQRRAYYRGDFGQSFDALTLTRSLDNCSTSAIYNF